MGKNRKTSGCRHLDILLAEGLSDKNYSPKTEGTDRVLVGHKKSEEYAREKQERYFGLLPYEIENCR